jgi:signal transduction histidine kinase
MAAADRGDFSELVRAAAAVAGQTELDAVLRTTIAMAKEATGAAFVALGVAGPHGGLSDFRYLGIDVAHADAIGNLPVGKGVLGTLLHDPTTIRIESISDHEDSVGFPAHHPPMQRFLGVPIRAGNEVFGNLYLTDKPEPFDEEDEALVEALAAIAGSAINAARLHDRLTQVALVEDRERIARDLHDAVIQDLFAVGLDLQGLGLTIQDESAADRIDRAVQRIDDAIASLRTFIFDLRSMSALHADPVGAIRRMSSRLAGSRAVDIEVSADDLGSPGARQLDDAMQIIREAVSNALRHGDPTSVRIQLSRSGTDLAVVIEDDGAGFDHHTAKKGMGLDNMRDRAVRHGGSLTVDSTPGVGTRITVSLRR